jgi:hypothetical protein
MAKACLDARHNIRDSSLAFSNQTDILQAVLDMLKSTDTTGKGSEISHRIKPAILNNTTHAAVDKQNHTEIAKCYS